MAENIEKIVAMRKFMDEHLSAYTFDPKMELEKNYKCVSYEQKSLAFINGDVFAISDSFIVYAITVLGCAEAGVIAEFLKIYKKNNPDFLIPEFDKDTIKTRLAALKKTGFLFNINYVDNTECNKNPDYTSGSHHSLYTAGKDATTLMNSRLRRQVKPNTWIASKPMDELLGIAASAMVFTKLMASPWFVKLENAIFKGRNCGTVKLDNEFISEMGKQKYYVGMMSVYLHMQPDFMSDENYTELINYKLNVINDYLLNRTKKGIAKMILVCESNKDMVRMAQAIINSGAFTQEVLNNIHFTSAGLVDGYGKGPEDWFLNIVLDPTAKNGFTYDISKPFI